MDDGLSALLLDNHGHPYLMDSPNNNNLMISSSHPSSNGYYHQPTNGYHHYPWETSSSSASNAILNVVSSQGSEAVPYSNDVSALKSTQSDLVDNLSPAPPVVEDVVVEEAESEEQQHQEEEEEPASIDVDITNVVCNFKTMCHLNLRQIANTGSNVEFKRDMGGILYMKMRKPACTAMIRSSGKISITGNKTEEDSKKSAKQVARCLQKLGFNVRFCGYRVNNVLAHVNLSFGIKLNAFAEAHPIVCLYEPELHPGATYRWKEKKAVFKIYQTGSVSITAPSVANIDAAVQHIFPLVHEHQKEKPMDNINHAHMKAARRKREETKAGRGLWGNNRKRLKTSHGRISLEDDDADLDDFIHDEDHDDDESSIEDEEEAISIHDEDEASSDDDDDDE